MIRALAVAALLLLVATGCASVKTGGGAVPPPESGRPPTPREAPPRADTPGGGEVTGMASWYGERHHGRRTASGESYDMNALTAAHRTLPFGTVVEVTNVKTGATVEVRINDRGPHIKGRIIDLSLAAARQIGLVGDGVAPVRLRVVNQSDDTRGVAGTPVPSAVTPAATTTDPPSAQPVSAPTSTPTTAR